MALLTTTIHLEEAEVFMSTLAAFVCSAYSPKASTSTQPLNSDGISSDNTRQKVTCALQQGGLKQHILRAHIQTRVWTEAAAGSTAGSPAKPLLQTHHWHTETVNYRGDLLSVPKAIKVPCRYKSDCSSHGSSQLCTHGAQLIHWNAAIVHWGCLTSFKITLTPCFSRPKRWVMVSCLVMIILWSKHACMYVCYVGYC